MFQKSDAKIEITITATNLIRIKYPLSGLNYHLSGATVANFNEIHCTVFEQQLFEQVAQLSQRDRAAGWVSYRQKWKTGTGRQYLQTIIGQYSTTATYLASKDIEIGEKTPNKGYYAVQGHPRSSKVIQVCTNRKPVCDFLLVINSN